MEGNGIRTFNMFFSVIDLLYNIKILFFTKIKTMDNIKWIFDGIGTAVFIFIVGLLAGGGVGYKIAINKTIKQTQKTGDNSNPTQIGQIENDK
jgi:hypothetical protein